VVLRLPTIRVWWVAPVVMPEIVTGISIEHRVAVDLVHFPSPAIAAASDV